MISFWVLTRLTSQSGDTRQSSSVKAKKSQPSSTAMSRALFRAKGMPLFRSISTLIFAALFLDSFNAWLNFSITHPSVNVSLFSTTMKCREVRSGGTSCANEASSRASDSGLFRVITATAIFIARPRPLMNASVCEACTIFLPIGIFIAQRMDLVIPP